MIDLIGNTPLIKLKYPSELTGCNIYGKAEFMNPGGSTQLTLTLGRHFGQDVTLVSALALIATRCFLEPLGGPAVNFCFWHLYYSALAQLGLPVVS